MSRAVLAAAVVLSWSLAATAQTPNAGSTAPAGGMAYAVAYVDMLPGSRAEAIGELMKYREASQRETGFVRMELFEQVRRGAHFTIVESWASAASLEAHAAGGAKQALLAAMNRIAAGGYDERPYAALSVEAPRAAAPDQAGIVVTHLDTAPVPGADPVALLRQLAEASRQETGNLRFDVLQHAMLPNHFTIIEVWTNPAAADAHAAAAHTRQFRRDIQPLIGSPLDERLVRSLD
jgi:quinol monooxygenase YgiN